MPNYRRVRIAGGSYFFTVNLLERRRTLLTNHIADLRAVFRAVRQKHPFHIDAIVVLPDHLHCIWTLPEGDVDYSTRWQLIKAGFARRIVAGERLSPRRQAKGERGIWQRRFWEYVIRDERDFAAHADYIHYNPVKHGYVGRVSDWPYSSFRKYVGTGIYPMAWAASPDVCDLEFE